MGYAWRGVCYADVNSALAAFVKSVPDSDAAGINTFSGTPTISGAGLITWSILNRPLSGTTASVRTGTTQLPVCSEGVDQWPLQSLLFPALLVFAFFIGFKSGFRP